MENAKTTVKNSLNIRAEASLTSNQFH